MPKIKYEDINFKAPTLKLIAKCDEILTRYSERGWDGITLRQLYYQLVSQNIIKNDPAVYHLLGVHMNNARMAGLIDWNHIIDRARQLRARSNWSSPDSIIASAANGYHLSYWKDQEYFPELWVEKDALIGVVQRAGTQLDVPYYACKGYNSVSQMWAAAQRFIQAESEGRRPIVFYLGDHDPSGVDMSRDIYKRLSQFGAEFVHVERIALNFDQARSMDLPKNVVKKGDSRTADYKAYFGTSDCWELDAIDVDELVEMIKKSVYRFIEKDAWDSVKKAEAKDLEELGLLTKSYQVAIDYLRGEVHAQGVTL